MLGQILLNGVIVGSIYALVAVGFVVVYRSVAMFNFAQTEYYTLGGDVFLVVTDRLAAQESALAALQGPGALLTEEVTADDIAGIVGAWTGIPVTKLLEGETAIGA